mgnify:FL=1
MNEVVWEDPPNPPEPLPRGESYRTKYTALRAACRNEPGRWARMNTYAQSNAVSIASILHKRWPGFEAVCREVEGKHVVYVRYVAEPA